MFKDRSSIIILALMICVNSNSQTLNLNWAKQFGGTSSDAGFSIVTDKSGNVFTIGNFLGMADFDPAGGTYTLNSFGSNNIFISKIDAAGNFIWAKQFDGTQCSGMKLDDAGNIYLAGFFQGTSDLDPGSGTFNQTSQGSNDIFISKLNSSGELIWTKQIGGNSSDMCFSIALDSLKNIYTTGCFIGTVDFDPGAAIFNLNSYGAQDVFISKIDSSGNFVWAKQIGGISLDVSNSIASDKNGNVYISGSFMGTADFDPGNSIFNLTSSGFLDIFAAKLDASGNFIWAGQMGSDSQDDEGSSLAVDANSNVYITGDFQDTADLDPGPGVFDLVSSGATDIFISKLDPSGNFIWAKQIGGPLEDKGNSIGVDTSGNVYTSGNFASTADFDPGTGSYNFTSAGMYDIFISKLNSSGNFVWAKQMGGDSLDASLALTLDAIGNVYATGYFTSVCDFDPGPGLYTLTSAGRFDVFNVKIGSGFLGINENNFVNNTIGVFPNPTSGKVNLVLKNKTENAKLKLINVTGQTILEKMNLTGNEFIIDISSEASGIYFLELNQNGNVSRTKLIKN